MAKEIPLSRGLFALVDDEDYPRLSAYKWNLTSDGYAARHDVPPQRKTILMHREIISAPSGFEVDHIDGCRINNQKSNLRLATRTENRRNLKPYRSNSTGFKGVVRTRTGFWAARIGLDGKKIHLGQYATPEEAALAYNLAALKYFGEFAKLNPVNLSGVPMQAFKAEKSDCPGITRITRPNGTVKWRVRVMIDGQRKHFGYYNDCDAARSIYQEILDVLEVPNEHK
jgi:hypothetical protein